jgi:hypothetical protein
MRTKHLKAPTGNRLQKWFRRARRWHNPMLVFNMSVFNSARVRECIFTRA